MKSYDDEAIQKFLDEITKNHGDDDTFVSVEFNDQEEFVVRFSETSPSPRRIPSSVLLPDEEGGPQKSIPVLEVISPKLQDMRGDIRLHPPLEISQSELIGVMGGDRCQNENANYYGTISFYADVYIKVSGACKHECHSSFALLSNNHVIGRSDAGSAGEVISTLYRKDTARLKCLVPFRCNPDVDVAIANVTNSQDIQGWTIRRIGRLAGVRRPRIGESIRKHGARTGYSEGKVTGKGNIRVGKNLFRGVFITSGGFGCPGDSGSAVISDSGDILGIFSWGQIVPCEQHPTGYFWTFIKPGSLSSESASDILLSSVSERQ